MIYMHAIKLCKNFNMQIIYIYCTALAVSNYFRVDIAKIQHVLIEKITNLTISNLVLACVFVSSQNVTYVTQKKQSSGGVVSASKQTFRLYKQFQTQEIK